MADRQPTPRDPSQEIAARVVRSRLKRLVEFEPEPESWTDPEIWQLREGILVDAIRLLLDGRGSLRSRQEVMDWVQDDSPGPFCFRICAMAAVVDPDNLRESLLWLLRRHGFPNGS